MKKFVAFLATWIFHYLPRCLVRERYSGCLLGEGDALPENPKAKSLAGGALLPTWNACPAQCPASGARRLRRGLGRRVLE